MVLTSPGHAAVSAAASILLLAAAGSAHAAGGLLRVTSSGADGRIFIDGRDTGERSPATFDNVPFGPHQVAIDSQCARGAANVLVQGPGASQVTVPMTAGTGTLVVIPNPADALITV
ncbi:MAG: PEGA domain-containing protein, partial [Myxococcota bacterium]|nr:PEGA domain-containing protein [Myxococcota bacterium]